MRANDRRRLVRHGQHNKRLVKQLWKRNNVIPFMRIQQGPRINLKRSALTTFVEAAVGSVSSLRTSESENGFRNKSSRIAGTIRRHHWNILHVLDVALRIFGNYDYWRKRNIPYIEPRLIFGNYTDVFLGRESVGGLMGELYRFSDGRPFAGFWRFRRPCLMVREPEGIKDVLLKEFNNFQENGFTVNPHLDPLVSKNPFLQTGDRWKTTRSILTPSFTTGKLKPLYSVMQSVSDEMVEYLRKTDGGADGLEAKNLASKYTMEMVATCGFGIKGNSFRDPNAELRRMARTVLEPGFARNLELLCINYLPSLANLLKMRWMPPEADGYFRRIVSDVMEHRENTGTTRNDYLQNLINLKKKFLNTPQAYSDEDVTAHTVTFLTDGFETSSVVLSFCLHDLAINPEYQDGIRLEIARARQAANGELTYEALLEMPLLDQVLHETLRVHTPFMAMEKVCTRDTTLRAADGVTAVRVPKGMLVVIPVSALHRDARHYEDPERFDPRRWAPDARKERGSGKFTFIPFGEGPRMCLGMRFAILQIKLALAAVVENFDIKQTPKTVKEVKQDPTFFLANAKDGLWVKFVPRK